MHGGRIFVSHDKFKSFHCHALSHVYPRKHMVRKSRKGLDTRNVGCAYGLLEVSSFFHAAKVARKNKVIEV